jgi:hypothetical protein
MAAREAIDGYIFAGKQEFKLSWFKNVTLEHAIKVNSNVSESSIKKVWKIANGLTKPNYLRD